MKFKLFAAILVLLPSVVHATIISGLTEADFISPLIEDFSNPLVVTSSYDFGNGMVFTNLNGDNDFVNYTGKYGLNAASGGDVVGGKNGDGYFGTGVSSTSFEFAFSRGTTKFGFYGAEALVDDGSFGRNGELDILFYDVGDSLIDSVKVSNNGSYAWGQFHGFMVNTASSIGRVVFKDVGHMVLDNVHFDPEPSTPESVSTAQVTSAPESVINIPEPTTFVLMSLGLVGLGISRIKKAV